MPTTTTRDAARSRAMTGEHIIENLLDRKRGLLRWYPTVRAHHVRAARMADGQWRTPIQGDAGFPDLVLVGPGGILYRECKGDREPLTHGQRAWLYALAAAGGDVGVWRPMDWLTGLIHAEIAELAR